MDASRNTSPQTSKAITPQFLSEWIASGLDKRLLLLIVPQKGEAMDWIYQAIAKIEGPMVWVILDASDNQPSVFQADLTAQLEKVFPKGLQGKTSNPGEPDELEDWIVLLINLIADWPERLVIVIDHYQVIVEEKIHIAIALLLDYLPPQGHMILISQCQPPLPLGHWRVRRQMVEFNLKKGG